MTLALQATIYWSWRNTGVSADPITIPVKEVPVIRGFSGDGKTLYSWHVDNSRFGDDDLPNTSFSLVAWDWRSRSRRFTLPGVYGWVAYASGAPWIAGTQLQPDGKRIAKTWNSWSGNVGITFGEVIGPFAGEFFNQGQIFVQFAAGRAKQSGLDYYSHRFDTTFEECSASELCVWDLARGQVVHSMPVGPITRTVEFSPEGKLVALLDTRGDLALYRLDQRNRLVSIANKAIKSTDRLRFSPDGKLLAMGLTICHTDDLSQCFDIPLPRDEIHELGFSPDSKLLFALKWGRVYVFELAARKLIGDFPFISNNRFIWYSNWNDVIVTRTMLQQTTGVASFAGCGWNTGVVVVEDDRLHGILSMDPKTGRIEHFASVWDLASKKELAKLNNCWSFFVSPDEQTAASVGTSGAMRGIVLWNLEEVGEPLPYRPFVFWSASLWVFYLLAALATWACQGRSKRPVRSGSS